MKLSIQIILILALLAATAPVKAQGLIIPSGAYVISGNGNIVLSSNWVNNGSFTHNSGDVIFAGSIQTLGGTTHTLFNNLTIAAGSNTSVVSAGQQVQGIVLCNDTLNANNNITLVSTATQTALISGSGTGEVLGFLSMQRYLASGFGYKYFSSPFKADTVNDFSQEINLATSFPDLYKFDESLTSAGWINYTNPSGLLTPLAGYAVNFGTSSAPLTVSLTGVVNNHTQSATLYNHNMIYTQGFNLVGNPYPSPIDWDAAGGWTKTNIDNAVYYFNNGTTNQYTGTYSSYVNGVSSNGVANSIISSMQGFFIHVSAGSYPVTGLLSVTNTARNLMPTTTFMSIVVPQGPQPLLRLTAGFATDETLSDPLVVYGQQGASTAFDKKWDALKLMNTHVGVPNLYALSTDTAKLSIYALPDYFDGLLTIPLVLKTAGDGQINFKAQDMLNIPAGLYIYLTDTRTGAVVDLQKQPLYSLWLQAGNYTNRFFLEYSTKELTPALPPVVAPVFVAYSAGGSLYINGNLPGGEEGSLRVVSMTGQVVWRQQLSGNTLQQLDCHLAAGVYIVNLYSRRGTDVKKIFINHP